MIAAVAAAALSAVPAPALASTDADFSVGSPLPSGGSAPNGIALDPSDSTLWIANSASNSVGIVDRLTGAVLASVPVGRHPNGIAVDAGARTAYVANGDDSTVTLIDTETRTVSSTLSVGRGANYIGVDPTRQRALVSNYTSKSLSVVDAATQQVTATLPLPANPGGIAVDTLTDRAFVALPGANSVAVVDLTSISVTSVWAIGHMTMELAYDAALNQIYVTGYNNSVTVLDATSGAVKAILPTGSGAQGVAVDLSTHVVYVANYYGTTVTVIDGQTRTVVGNRYVGTGVGGYMARPASVVVDQKRHIAFVTMNGASHVVPIVHHLADVTPPTVVGTADRPSNSAGWYNAPVTVTWAATDPEPSSGSPIAPTPTVLDEEGANQVATSSTSCDPIGNCAAGSLGPVSIDMTAPTVTIEGVADGGSYTLGQEPRPTCSAADELSGRAGDCAMSTTGGNANGVGLFTATATAVDVAGNETTKSVNYRIIYAFSGFLQPINDTAHQTSASTSIFRAGSTVPVKFVLSRADGSAVQPLAAPVWLIPVKVGLLTQGLDEATFSLAPDSGSYFRLADGQWVYNWGTNKADAGHYWRIGARLDDGTVHWANIGLR